MLIKLTYYGKGAPTLINSEKIQTIYQLYDKTQGKYSTKVTFSDNTYVNVEEDLETILKIQQDFYEGKYQDPTCPPPSIETKFQDSYNSERPRRPRVKKEEFYNTNTW